MKYYSQDGKYSIEVAIQQDMCKWAEYILVQRGFRNVEPNNALRQYCEMELRFLEARPRKIKKSREFLCPVAFEDGLKELEIAIETGLPLMPYMSKNIENVAYQDKFLNDWGLFHFHLGLSCDVKDTRFQARTGYLLVAYVDINSDDTIYFLQVLPHKKEIWTRQNLIRILVDNWPEKVRLLDGVSRLAEDVSDNAYCELREANINTFVDLKDGRVVFPPNFGLTCAGTSARAMISYIMRCNDAESMEINISQSVEWICGVINNRMIVPENRFVFRMIKPNKADYTFSIEGTDLFIRVFIYNGRLTAVVGDDRKEIEEYFPK